MTLGKRRKNKIYKKWKKENNMDWDKNEQNRIQISERKK